MRIERAEVSLAACETEWQCVAGEPPNGVNPLFSPAQWCSPSRPLIPGAPPGDCVKLWLDRAGIPAYESLDAACPASRISYINPSIEGGGAGAPLLKPAGLQRWRLKTLGSCR